MRGFETTAGDIANGDRGPTRKLLSFPRTNRIAFLASRPVHKDREKKLNGEF
ncbi:unnamed protein product [Penicillium camemberti]|uniref:Str. FM013 n=1 Tax=Penicillium camemberti (strain FM 013) TaxID=1429867 RepID=A0A0G4PCN1_PENC3|nr:unnamed protein product [Penicillium camemberti]